MKEKISQTKWDVIKRLLKRQNTEIANLKESVKELKAFKQEMIQILEEAEID